MDSPSAINKTPLPGRFSWSALIFALGILTYLGAWLTPNHYPPWVSFHGESLAFAALLMFSLAFLLVSKQPVLDRAVWLPVLLIGVIWLQWGAGQIIYFGEATVSSLYLGGFTLAWLLGSNLADKPEAGIKIQNAVAWMLVIAATISVYIALLQWLDLEAGHAGLVLERSPRERPYGNLAQPNHLATLILMGGVMSIWLYNQECLRRWQTWALIVWFSFGLTMTQSRSGWLSAALLGLFLLWRGQATWRIGGLRAVMGWWLLLLVMWLAWKPLNVALMLTGHSRELVNLTQDNARMILWRQILAGIEQSPWWGYGWGQTVAGHKAGSTQVSSGMLTGYSHSLVLDLTLWLGIPLAVMVMAVMARWLLRAVHRIDHPRQWVLIAAALPVLVHSLVEFPFAYAYFLFVIAWMFGSLSALQSSEKKLISNTNSWGTGRYIWFVGILAFSGMSVWLAFEYMQAEEDYRVMRFEMRSVGQTPDGYEVPEIVLLNQLGAVLRLGRLKPHPEMTVDELKSMRELNKNYNWATLQMRYVVALSLNGHGEQAKKEMEILRMHFGEKSYEHAKKFILELEYEQYPQLKALRLSN